MRGLCLFALPLLLSGCGGEPDFDERYRRKAGEMERIFQHIGVRGT